MITRIIRRHASTKSTALKFKQRQLNISHPPPPLIEQVRITKRRMEKSERDERVDIALALTPVKTYMGGFTRPRDLRAANWFNGGPYKQRGKVYESPPAAAYQPYTVFLLESRYDVKHGIGRVDSHEWVIGVCQEADFVPLLRKYNSPRCPETYRESMDNTRWPWLPQFRHKRVKWWDPGEDPSIVFRELYEDAADAENPGAVAVQQGNNSPPTIKASDGQLPTRVEVPPTCPTPRLNFSKPRKADIDAMTPQDVAGHQGYHAPPPNTSSQATPAGDIPSTDEFGSSAKASIISGHLPPSSPHSAAPAQGEELELDASINNRRWQTEAVPSAAVNVFPPSRFPPYTTSVVLPAFPGLEPEPPKYHEELPVGHAVVIGEQDSPPKRSELTPRSNESQETSRPPGGVALFNGTPSTIGPEAIQQLRDRYMPTLQETPFWRPLLTATFSTRPLAITVARLSRALPRGLSFVASMSSDDRKCHQSYTARMRCLRADRLLQLAVDTSSCLAGERGGFVGIRFGINDAGRAVGGEGLADPIPWDKRVVKVGVGGWWRRAGEMVEAAREEVQSSEVFVLDDWGRRLDDHGAAIESAMNDAMREVDAVREADDADEDDAVQTDAEPDIPAAEQLSRKSLDPTMERKLDDLRVKVEHLSTEKRLDFVQKETHKLAREWAERFHKNVQKP